MADRSPIYKPLRSSSMASTASSTSSTSSTAAGKTSSLPPPYEPRFGSEASVRRRPARMSVAQTKSLAVVAIGVSTLCMLVVLPCSFFVLSSHRGQEHEEEVCVPCLQVRADPVSGDISPLEHLLHVRPSKDVPDTQDYCARTPTQYAALFKLILQRQEVIKRLAGLVEDAEQRANRTLPGLQPSPVSAHLALNPNAEISETLRWKSGKESPLSRVGPGLTLSEGGDRLTVTAPGLYFIYCQVLYGHTGEMTSSPRPKLATSYVMRYSPAFPAAPSHLLKARHTRRTGLPGHPDRHPDCHSAYVGGMHVLHAGDQLYVKVSAPHAVSHDDTATFLGLFRVAS